MDLSAVPVPVEEPGSPKEGLHLSARTMTGTNAAGGTFGLGLDQFELPKASIAKLARSEVRTWYLRRSPSRCSCAKTR